MDRNAGIFFMAALMVLASAAASDALEDQRIGRVTYVERRVDRSHFGAPSYVPVVREEFVWVGDVVRTKSYSKAEITFADKSVVRLAENSQVTIKDYVLEPSGNRQKAALCLERGKIRATVSKSQGAGPAEFVIETPNARGSIKGSDMFVSHQKSATSVLALEGTMALCNPKFSGKSVDVGPSMAAFVPAEEPPTPPRVVIPVEIAQFQRETDVPEPAKAPTGPADTGKALVTKVTGNVLSRVGAKERWHRMEPKEAVKSGNEIQTMSDGQVEVVLESGRVVQLRPNSQLIVKKLSCDPKTGAREDLFESTYGKIRVSVEKLKANSKFEVKSPTAIAGVRGTIMYLDIGAAGMQVYFEGGTGYLGDTSGNVVQEVGHGQNASADNQGNVSSPAETTPEQRQEFESGWDPVVEAFGFSDAEPQKDTPANNEEVHREMDWGNELPLVDEETYSDLNEENLFEDNPQEPSDDPSSHGESSSSSSSSPSIENLALPISLRMTGQGYFESDGSFKEHGNRTWTATVTSVTNTDFWDGEALAPLVVSGSYRHNINAPTLWWGEASGSSSDGGYFYGRMGGTQQEQNWYGSQALLAIDALGVGGVALSDISGAGGMESSGDFSGGGRMLFYPVTLTDIEPKDIAGFVRQGSLDSGLVSGTFRSDSGYVYGTITGGSTWFLQEDFTKGASEPWGVMEIRIGGSDNRFCNPMGDASWSTSFAGPGVFGRMENQALDSGYWFARAENGIRGENVLNGQLEGQYLTSTQMGSIAGSMTGSYSVDQSHYIGHGASGGGYLELSTGSWQAVAYSVYYGKPLDFAGKTTGEFIVFDQAGNDAVLIGSGSGIMGGTGDLWTPGVQSEMSCMGTFSSLTRSEPLLWGWNVTSYDALKNRDETFDGGAFMGWIGGTWSHYSMEGISRLLYVSPDPDLSGDYEAGILQGHATGDYMSDTVNPSTGFWGVDGYLTAGPYYGKTQVPPEELLEKDLTTGKWIHIDEHSFEGFGNGVLDTGAVMTASSLEGAYFNIQDQTWGLWRAKFGGTYSGSEAVFRMALGANSLNGEDRVSLLTFDGQRMGGAAPYMEETLSGTIQGVWVSISDLELSRFIAGYVEGESLGNLSAQAQTWQAVGLATWVQCASLDPVQVGYTMDDLKNFVSIPITEQYSSLLNMNGDFGSQGSIQGAMNTSFYRAEIPDQGIWASVLSGSYSGMPQVVESWQAVVNGPSNAGAVGAVLNGVQWSEGQWLANVQNTSESSVQFRGQAGGTYTPDTSDMAAGTFKGVGTGTWENAPQ